MNRLENGALVANVAGRSQTKTADQTGAHVGQNVSVQVGHNQNLVVVGNRVSNHFQASVVEELRIKFDVRELFGDFTGGAQE